MQHVILEVILDLPGSDHLQRHFFQLSVVQDTVTSVSRGSMHPVHEYGASPAPLQSFLIAPASSFFFMLQLASGSQVFVKPI